VGLGRAGWLTQVIRGLAGPGGLVLPSPYIYIYIGNILLLVLIWGTLTCMTYISVTTITTSSTELCAL
jgi:hypothetical protein